MRFSKERPVKIVMLGAGGTGGHIAPHLYRLLYALDRPVRFIICDGDIVEQKNLVRQNFIPADLGENKAKVLAERYATVFGMETEYVPAFVESEEKLRELLTPRQWRTGYYGDIITTARSTHLVSCASLLLKSGVSMKEIQEWLGHSNFSTTANIYAHLDSSSKTTTGSTMADKIDISCILTDTNCHDTNRMQGRTEGRTAEIGA